MSNFLMRAATAAIAGVLMTAAPAHAATYYASPSGSGTACSLSAPCSLSTLNGVLKAGDTGYLRAGTYTQQIKPANNGTSDSARITYAAYTPSGGTRETVEIAYKNPDMGQAHLDEKQYITIDGLRFMDGRKYGVSAKKSKGVTVQNSYFKNATRNSVNVCDSSYPKILNSVFDSGNCGSTTGDSYGCPYDHVTTYNSGYGIYEGNTFNEVAHYALSMSWGGNHNIVRNNIFQNTWHAGLGWGMTKGAARNLAEFNIFRNQGENHKYNPGERDRNMERRHQRSVQCYSECNNNILRRNIFYNNGGASISSGTETNGEAVHNKVYNNTFDQEYNAVIMEIHSTTTPETAGNVFTNNAFSRGILYNVSLVTPFPARDVQSWVNNNWYKGVTNRYKAVTAADSTFTENSSTGINGSFASEFINNLNVDPKFTNWDARDYTLQASSPLIDAGAWLTTTKNSGTNSTTLVVEDAGYFIDGWGIVNCDDIQFEGQSTTHRIKSINYDTNTITLASPATWTSGKGVALPYSGAKPDIGAKEYKGTKPTPDPTPPVSLGSTIRVNCGGGAMTDSSGNVWAADTGYNTGSTYTSGNAIEGTADDALFQSHRWDGSASPELAYSFALPNGSYKVNLKFAETYVNAAGARVFDVYLENARILDDADIYKTAGKNKAVTVTVPVTVSDGKLDIQFGHVKENPMISGIEIVPNMQGHWTLDGGSINGKVVKDSSGSGNHGELIGSPMVVAGKTGQALRFAISGVPVQGVLLPSMPLKDASFSVAAWLNPDSMAIPSQQVWFGAQTSPTTGNSLHLRLNGNGSVRMGFYYDDLDSPAGSVIFGQWQHVAVTYDLATDTSKIYVNGALKATGKAGPFKGTTPSVFIGRWTGSSQPFKGAIDDVRLYGHALTATEVSQIANGKI